MKWMCEFTFEFCLNFENVPKRTNRNGFINEICCVNAWMNEWMNLMMGSCKTRDSEMVWNEFKCVVLNAFAKVDSSTCWPKMKWMFVKAELSTQDRNEWIEDETKWMVFCQGEIIHSWPKMNENERRFFLSRQSYPLTTEYEAKFVEAELSTQDRKWLKYNKRKRTGFNCCDFPMIYLYILNLFNNSGRTLPLRIIMCRNCKK